MLLCISNLKYAMEKCTSSIQWTVIGNHLNDAYFRSNYTNYTNELANWYPDQIITIWQFKGWMWKLSNGSLFNSSDLHTFCIHLSCLKGETFSEQIPVDQIYCLIKRVYRGWIYTWYKCISGDTVKPYQMIKWPPSNDMKRWSCLWGHLTSKWIKMCAI